MNRLSQFRGFRIEFLGGKEYMRKMKNPTRKMVFLYKKKIEVVKMN